MNSKIFLLGLVVGFSGMQSHAAGVKEKVTAISACSQATPKAGQTFPLGGFVQTEVCLAQLALASTQTASIAIVRQTRVTAKGPSETLAVWQVTKDRQMDPPKPGFNVHMLQMALVGTVPEIKIGAELSRTPTSRSTPVQYGIMYLKFKNGIASEATASLPATEIELKNFIPYSVPKTK